MRRKLLGLVAAVGLVAAFGAPAGATGAAGVVTFIGDATVGAGAYPGATGEGLCLPGRQNTAGCPAGGTLAQEAQGWKFSVPGAGGGTLPATCRAAGSFFGATVVPGALNNCALDSSGTVFANPAGVGPSCGMSGGDSTAGLPDTITVNGVEKPIFTRWITSAGGTLPIDGYVLDHGAQHAYAGVVQARPLQPGACETAPATIFTVVGVVAIAAQ